jgi:hypothetical protein
MQKVEGSNPFSRFLLLAFLNVILVTESGVPTGTAGVSPLDEGAGGLLEGRSLLEDL